MQINPKLFKAKPKGKSSDTEAREPCCTSRHLPAVPIKCRQAATPSGSGRSRARNKGCHCYGDDRASTHLVPIWPSGREITLQSCDPCVCQLYLWLNIMRTCACVCRLILYIRDTNMFVIENSCEMYSLHKVLKCRLFPFPIVCVGGEKERTFKWITELKDGEALLSTK